jgi:hypothetical protein
LRSLGSKKLEPMGGTPIGGVFLKVGRGASGFGDDLAIPVEKGVVECRD